jgi:hypothetical protein
MLRNRSEKADKKVDLLRYSTSRGRECGLSFSSLHPLNGVPLLTEGALPA